MAAVALLVALFLLALPATSMAKPVPGDPCPNEAIRQQQGVTHLPDCMALEMVTPPDKANRLAGQVSFSPSISADGERVSFESGAPLGGTEGLGSPLGDTYIASRGGTGWSTRATAPPAAFGYRWGDVSGPGYPLSLTPAFDRWLSLQATVEQAQSGQMTLYEADLAGNWTPRSPLLVPLDGHHGITMIREAQFDLSGASPDLSHVFMRPANLLATESDGTKAFNGYSTAYLPGDPQPRQGFPGGSLDEVVTFNTYVFTRGPAGEPRVALMTRDSAGRAWGGNCGAFLGGGKSLAVFWLVGGRSQGAVSSDGTVAYFSTRPTQPQPNPSNPTYPRCVGQAAANVVLAGNPVVANVVTAKGTGTTSEAAEPNVIREVSTTSGAFEVGQTVEVSGSAVAPGTTITAVEEESETLLRVTLSNPVTAGGGTGKELKAGAAPLAVGEEVSGTCLAGKPCFAPGTTITAVNGLSVTVSPPPLATGLAVALRVVAPLRIMKRQESPAGQVAIAELVEGGPAAGSDYFEGASEDQRRVYFTSDRKLAPTDQDPGTGECAAATVFGTVPLGGSRGCDLYLYEALPGGGHEVVQVSAGDATAPVPGASGDVFRGITAISGDGSHVYFAAQGALTAHPNPEGAVAAPPAAGEGTLTSGSTLVTGVTTSQGVFEPGMGISGEGIPAATAIESVAAGTLVLSQPATASGVRTMRAADLNLYAYRRDAAHPSGLLAFVGALDSACTSVSQGTQSPDCSSLAGAPISYWTDATVAPLRGAGSTLVFESTAPLTANDRDGRHLDVFRYRPDSIPPTLECVSCLPGGVEDSGPFNVTRRATGRHVSNPGLEFAEHERWASEDGESIVFATAEPLLPEDVDGQLSDYLWQRGKLSLLPGSGERPTISRDGSEVAFETPEPLLPQDGDTATDVYLARAGGGFAIPPEAVPCAGESCQGQPSAQPPVVGATTKSFSGRGNQKVAKHKKKHHKKHKKHKRKHKSRNGKRAGAKQLHCKRVGAKQRHCKRAGVKQRHGKRAGAEQKGGRR